VRQWAEVRNLQLQKPSAVAATGIPAAPPTFVPRHGTPCHTMPYHTILCWTTRWRRLTKNFRVSSRGIWEWVYSLSRLFSSSWAKFACQKKWGKNKEKYIWKEQTSWPTGFWAHLIYNSRHLAKSAELWARFFVCVGVNYQLINCHRFGNYFLPPLPTSNCLLINSLISCCLHCHLLFYSDVFSSCGPIILINLAQNVFFYCIFD